MKTNKSTKILATLAMAGIIPVVAFAGNTGKTMTERGAVARVDEKQDKLTVRFEPSNGLKPRTFAWNQSTRFIEDGKTVPASALKVGESVTVQYAKEGKANIAREIEITPSAQHQRTSHGA
jgi:hypothetical protein